MDALLSGIPPHQVPPCNGFAESMFMGLAKRPKEMACKYFYDETGSRLFDQICDLPEYYQARTETVLLERNAAEIAALMGPDVEIVEFGAGSLRKVRPLLEALKRPRAYTPMDISGDHLAEAVRGIGAEYPGLTLRPLVADFTLPMNIPTLPGRPRRAGFFPGNTIGNFNPDAATVLLGRMRSLLTDGSLLVGVDLVKDPRRLHAAYNDAAGITAAFNKNVLVRANRELDADFDPEAFVHYAPYNASARRIEMHLVSLKRQTVAVAGQRFEFGHGESVHTEDSYKYTIASFREIAARAGFRPRAVWTDVEQLFSIHWLEG